MEAPDATVQDGIALMFQVIVLRRLRDRTTVPSSTGESYDVRIGRLLGELQERHGLSKQDVDEIIQEKWLEFEGMLLQYERRLDCIVGLACIQAMLKAGIPMHVPSVATSCGLGTSCCDCTWFSEATPGQSGAFMNGLDVFTGKLIPGAKP